MTLMMKLLWIAKRYSLQAGTSSATTRSRSCTREQAGDSMPITSITDKARSMKLSAVIRQEMTPTGINTLYEGSSSRPPIEKSTTPVIISEMATTSY